MSQDNRRADSPSESPSRTAATPSSRPRTPSQVSVSSSRNNSTNGRNNPPRRGRFWRGLGLVLAIIVAAGAAYGTLTKHGRKMMQTVTHGAVIAYQVKQNPDRIFDDAGSDHVNILLIGRDVNYKPAKVYDPRTKTFRPYHVVDKDTPARADSMIVMSLDKTKGTVRMLSVPRDSMVHMPPNEYHVKRAKLNAAHAYGGPQLLVKTFHDSLGITIQHYAVIKFDGFKKLIDDVGGVEVNVEGALLRNKATGKLYRGDLNYDDNWGNLHQHMKPGLQTLNGQQAHDYVRFREDIEGDTGRMRRQQQVMRALAKKIMHTSPLELPSRIEALRQQFDTDMTDEQLASAAYFTRGLGDSAKIQPITMFGVYSSRGSFTLNRPKNIKLLNVIFGSTFSPNLFLADSPSTDEDEVTSANDTNPGAQEVLREAGLLKGQVDPKLADNADDMSAQGRSNNDVDTANSSLRTASADSSTGNDANQLPKDASTRSSDGTTASSTSSETASSSQDASSAASSDGAPDNRVVIASTDPTPGDTADASATPRTRHRRRHRVTSDASSSDTSTAASSSDSSDTPRPLSTSRRHRRRSSSSSSDSPIPQPESSGSSSSSDSSGDSPIPRAE